MQKTKIIELLNCHNTEHAEKFATYVTKLFLEKKGGKPKNPWIQNRKEEEMANLFKRVAKEGLVFDGENITLGARWDKELGGYAVAISYNYQAYKNKMFLAYPETKIDLELVYQADTFECAKLNGEVTYHHDIKDPFEQADEKIVGGYCVIKNKRGEFLTRLSKKDFEKHRKIAQTDYIWTKWYRKMCLKTLIRKACGTHFKDTFTSMDENDNENFDLDLPLDVNLKHKQAIEKIENMKDLRDYRSENQGEGKELDQLLRKRMNQLNPK